MANVMEIFTQSTYMVCSLSLTTEVLSLLFLLLLLLLSSSSSYFLLTSPFCCAFFTYFLPSPHYSFLLSFREHSKLTQTKPMRGCVWLSGTTVPIPSPACVCTHCLSTVLSLPHHLLSSLLLPLSHPSFCFPLTLSVSLIPSSELSAKQQGKFLLSILSPRQVSWNPLL